MMRLTKIEIPAQSAALPGRDTPVYVPGLHYVNGNPMGEPFPDNMQIALFGMGCFWGAEKAFWSLEGVFVTAVGYGAGYTPNPTYQEVCSGMTGHNELVLVVYNPDEIDFSALLQTFWTSHNPTQGMRQGNDIGTQYRSGIYYSSEAQHKQVLESVSHYQEKLHAAGFGVITTEILPLPEFYYAEEYHQQYLAKNPQGYCGLGGTGVSF